MSFWVLQISAKKEAAANRVFAAALGKKYG
jgi:hypothetical protein